MATEVLNGRLRVTTTSLLERIGKEAETIRNGIAYFTPIGKLFSFKGRTFTPTCTAVCPGFRVMFKLPFVDLLAVLPSSYNSYSEAGNIL